METILTILLVWAFAGLLILSIWICSKIAYAAFRKNRSYWTFFWLSFLFSPILTGLVIALLPFDNEDPANPREIRRSKPDLAEDFKSLKASLKASKIVAILAGIVTGIVTLVAAGQALSSLDFGNSPEHTIKSVEIPQGTPLSTTESKALEGALIANCEDLPGNIYTIANLDKVAGHYSVIAENASYGDFQITKSENTWLIKALDSHLGYVAWGCDAVISAQ